ncbi:MAG: phage tail tape measure protein, partial [Candidatus Nanopelagicales bacterium]
MADTIITVGGDLTPLERQIQDVLSKNFKLSGIDSRRFTQPLGKIKGQLGEFEKSLEASNARVVAFGASAGAIYLLGDAFKGLVRSTIEVEKSLADINTVLGESSSNIKKFGNEIFNVANETSQSFETAAQAALEFSRQGLGLEETLKRTSAALTLAKISGLSAADSVEALTATINSFNDAALTDIQIVNKLAAVDARYAVSSADLAEAIKRVGSSASEAGVSLDQLIALVTSAQQTTARGGAVIGNSFKTIFTRIQRPKVLESLEEIGITTKTVTGQTLPLIQILNQLASTYDSLGAAQKSQIAELVGGVYQINILKAVVGDLSKEFGSTYAGALRASSTATNEAEKRIGSLAQTLDSQINRITNNLKRAGSVIGDLTIAPALEKVLGAANNILETFALGKEPESYGEKAAVGFLKGLGNFISGPGLILGAAAAFQIFKRLAAFVNDAGKTILGLGQASQRQAEIQAQILQLLQRNPALYSQIQSGAISVQDAAQGYLNIVNLTNAALERQKALAGQIAQVAFSGGAGPITGATRGPRRRASSGFIPNFAAEGQILESVGAANHKNGYKAGQAYQTTIHDGEGNSFRSWVNSAEKVKTFTNAAGYKATIVRPPNGFGPGTQMAAEGFVPNFAAKKAKDKGLRIFRSDAKVSSISGSSLNASFDRKQSSYRINIRPTSTAFFESSDKRKQMDTGRKSLDAGYTVENGQIVPNSAFDKFMGAINVYKVADAEEINTAANATWEGLIKKDPSWITNPVFSQFGLSSKNARRAFFNSLRKSKLSYADIKEKFNRQNGNATNDAVYKFGSGKTMTSPEDYKKSLNGDFNNFKGAFYEAFIANKLGSKYSLSKGDYDPVDIVAKEGAGTKFKGFEVKSGSVANVSTLVNKALNSINFNSANDAPAVVDFGTFPVIQTRGSSIGGVSNFSSGFIPNFAPGDGSYTLAEYANKKGVLISQLKGAALNAAYAKGVSLEEIKRYNPKFEYKGATAQEAARRQASVKALEQQHAYRGKPVLEKVLPWNKTVDDFGGDNNKFGSAYEQEVFAMLKKKYQNRFKTATELGLVGIRAKDGQILENNYSDVEGAVLDKKGRVMFWVEVKAQSKKRHLSFRRTGKDRVSDKFERAERKNINLPTNPRVRGIVFRNLAKGFIPNFANGYIDKVMNLESNISGNRAILDTTTGPFPFIRNSSQPNFAAAISDHGGLNNALNDSLRNQKNAGLMSGGYVPNFAAKAMLPGPEAIQEILANQKKKLITNLDFDNTLVKTKGDEEYAKAKSQEAKQAVLNKYFRNPIARMRDVKRSPLTTFGNDLLRGIRRGSIDPKYLGIMTASDNTPGLADFLLRRFRIPKKNMKFGIRGAVGKPPIEAKLGLAGKYENRKTGSGSVVDDLAYPNQSRGFIPNFANSQEDIFSKIKIKNKEDGIESYFPKSSKFKNQKVAGSVRAFPIAPNLYSVTSAGVNMKGFGFGVALYDTLLAEVSKKGAWLTSDRETVSDDAKQIWDGYRKQRTVDVQSKKLPMKYWNLHPAFNGGSYEFSMNPEEDFLRNKSTWPPIGDAVWSLQHAYKFKKHALDTFKNITVQAGIAHERRAIEKKEAEDAQLAKVNAAKQLIVSGNVLERNSEKTGINYLMGSLNISRKEATKRVKKYKKDQAKRYAEYEKLIPLDEDQRVVIDLATEKTYSKPFIYHHYDIATTEPDLKKYNIQSSQDLEERDNLVRAYLIAKKWEKPSLKYLLTEVNKNFVTKHKKQNFLLGLKKNWASRFAPGVTRRMSDYKMLVQGLPHLTSEGEHVVANDSKALPRMSSSSGFIPNFNNSNLNSSLRRAALGVRGLTPFVIDLKRKTSEVGGNNTLWHKDIVNKQFVTGEGKDKKRIYGGRYDLNDQDIHSSEYANTFVRGFVNKDTGQVLIDLTAAQKLDPEFRSKHREFVNNELDKISKRYTPKSSKGNIPQIPKRILTEYAKFTRYNPLAFNSPPESANKGFIPNF